MNDILKKISDNSIQLIESGILVAVVSACFFIDVPNSFINYYSQDSLPIQDFFWYIIVKLCTEYKLILIIIVFLVVLKFIRKWNVDNDVIMNKKNVYHNYTYQWYSYCAKILGIKKCNLILVPIEMQFRLVINSVFESFPLDESEFPILENEPQCKVLTFNDFDQLEEVNVILEDTYLIQNSQLPVNKVNLHTIKISRNDGTRISRHFSQQFIDTIQTEIRKLPENITINIYATTNPRHIYAIGKSTFRLADRSNIKKIYVFQQKKEEPRNFESKGYRVY